MLGLRPVEPVVRSPYYAYIRARARLVRRSFIGPHGSVELARHPPRPVRHGLLPRSRRHREGHELPPDEFADSEARAASQCLGESSSKRSCIHPREGEDPLARMDLGVEVQWPLQ